MRTAVALLIVLFCFSVQAAPSKADIENYKSRMDFYVGSGQSPENVARLLTNWFGWIFAVRQYGNDFDIVIEIRNSNGIIYFETVGTMEYKK